MKDAGQVVLMLAFLQMQALEMQVQNCVCTQEKKVAYLKMYSRLLHMVHGVLHLKIKWIQGSSS